MIGRPNGGGDDRPPSPFSRWQKTVTQRTAIITALVLLQQWSANADTPPWVSAMFTVAVGAVIVELVGRLAIALAQTIIDAQAERRARGEITDLLVENAEQTRELINLLREGTIGDIRRRLDRVEQHLNLPPLGDG